MRTAILAVWTIGLLGALPATLTILKLAQLVVSALLDIRELAALTRDAARALAKNVAPLPTLPDLSAPAARLADQTRNIAVHARMTDAHLSEV